jgi:hypothetical protein
VHYAAVAAEVAVVDQLFSIGCAVMRYVVEMDGTWKFVAIMQLQH